LETCVGRVLELADDDLQLEIIIVDDCSTDRSLDIARSLKATDDRIQVLHHAVNQGKGAALNTGFGQASGDYVAVQDADLEYDPQDLKRLLEPLEAGKADVVLGSRFLATGAHRVLYFWHSLGNRFLTFLSNMFTDLNLTDMETCYKVFRREVIQSIDIKEKRFGIEPEIIAKVAHMRLRIFEMGVSYSGRTYAEGKKIGVSDGFRAIYCILRYNAHHAPTPIQFLVYLFIGGMAALVNWSSFMGFYTAGWSLRWAAGSAFAIAALTNYLLGILLLFRHRARWNSGTEIGIFAVAVAAVGLVDIEMTTALVSWGFHPGPAKAAATAAGLILNFAVRKYLVFPEPSSGPWKPQAGSPKDPSDQ
jgi:dolichol-phosphate mannosyltransferase